jgi:hypothetical protein
VRASLPLAILTAVLAGLAGCGRTQEEPPEQAGAAGPKDSAAPRAVSFVSPDAVAAVIAHPGRVFSSPLATRAGVSREELAALVSGTVGIDLREVEELVLLLAPPSRDARGQIADSGEVWIVRNSEPIDAGRLLQTTWRPPLAPPRPRIDEVPYEGHTYYRRSYPRSELLGVDFPVQAAFFPDERSVVFAAEKRLQRLLSANEGAGPLGDRLRQTNPDHDLVAVLAAEPFRRAIGEESSKRRAALPAAIAALLTLSQDLKYATLTADLGAQTAAELALEARDAQSAAKVEEWVKKALAGLQATLAAAPQRASQDQAAIAVLAGKLAERALAGVALTRRGDQVLVRLAKPPGMDELGTKLIAQSVAQAKADARAAVDRARQTNKLRELARAMLLYENAHQRFPQPALRDKSGKALLSWRVQILRELGQGELYKQFHLEEPWDSQHNKKLIDGVPEVFRSASGGQQGTTPYVLFVGPGTPLDGEKPISASSMRDGLSNTIMIVEAGPDKAVPWTKPEDVTFDAADPIAPLGKLADKGFMAVFFDGHCETIDNSVSPARLRQLISPHDGVTRDDNESPGKTQGSVPGKTTTKTPGP